MIPRSKHVIIVIALAIALLAGLLFARSVTGRADNIAAVALFATEVIVSTTTRHAAPEVTESARNSARDAFLKEINTTPQ